MTEIFADQKMQKRNLNAAQSLTESLIVVLLGLELAVMFDNSCQPLNRYATFSDRFIGVTDGHQTDWIGAKAPFWVSDGLLTFPIRRLLILIQLLYEDILKSQLSNFI